ncbi:MAG TPA: prepilin-type N-terminal cleavage/methylation domain-containing protein [Thermoanaerobaculia bacterium]|nr:prepilin-type N-terminal cleavage/methylation domain-containing protein [Thermoanaerobaculia bacterium]
MKRQAGMTLVEALVAMAIVGVIVISSTRLVATAMRSTRDNLNRQFAAQKAISMLEELRALIQTQSGATTIVLDDYDNGTTNVPLLTTQLNVSDPAHPASGNRLRGTNWLFTRRITVQKMRGVNDLRLVNVKVFVDEATGPRLLAEVAGALSTIGQNAPPTQVYDVYLIAIENVPGWWLHMQNIVPFVEGAMQDLEARHPGLQFRKHWIRKLSYGRDPFYTPYVNQTAESTAAIPSVYFYPGKMPAGSAVDNYYPPDFFNGQVAIDGTLTNGYDPDENPIPYALADQFNHGMRYEDELALFNARVGAELETDDAPTFRLLLDDMIMRPGRYRNAIVINLHGELFPFPPVRNYSDAAKAPGALPHVRVVTHPERLRYGNDDALRLRVYSYHTNVANPGVIAEWLGQNHSALPISIVLKDVLWTPAANGVVAVSGGVDFDGNGAIDTYSVADGSATSSPTSTPTRMWWSSAQVGGDTIIRLYNSPMKTPCVTATSTCDGGGLDPSRRLYALEYIPSPVENLPDGTSPVAFSTTLATPGQGVKNTARWILNIPTDVLPDNDVITIETRIGADLATSFPNLSRTYAWRGTDTWLFGDAANEAHLPMTERFQLIGDPRHCPYADMKLPHAASGLSRADALGMGYNRYFDDFHANVNARSTWPGWSYSAGTPTEWFGIKNNTSDNNANNDGWESAIEVDVSRMMQILRTAVTRSHSVYTTMTGFSYFYVGIGGEIGYDDSNGFPNSIAVSSVPFTGGTGWQWEQSITGGGVKYIRESSNATDYWWSMSWLGELAPDSTWNTWSTTGNLPAGSAAGQFRRVLRSSINTRLPEGTSLRNAERRTAEAGSTAFFWSGELDETFHHRYADNTTGTRAAGGNAIASTYKMPLPPTIANSRPFDIDVDDTGMNPDHFLQSAYGAASTLQREAEFYRHSSNIPGSALLSLRNGSDAAFVVVNGLSPTGESGVAFISRWSFLSLIQSFLAAGQYSQAGVPDPARVRELPRVVITWPNDDVDLENPPNLDVQWQAAWTRWDGLPYTPDYADTFTEDTTVRYVPLYSRDNGQTWLYMEDDTRATVGVRPGPEYLQTATSYLWNVPAPQFPKGNYVIRVEAYRDEIPLHYSFHQYRAFIKR